MMQTPNHRTSRYVLLSLATLAAVTTSVHAQHSGDIALDVVDGQLHISGPIGSLEDTDGVFLATFGDTGFTGLTPNPGFDAAGGTFEPGRIGFDAMSGLLRWDPASNGWLAPEAVGESLSIRYFNFNCVVEDDPIAGYDLAVQPDGGWHRHMNFVLQADSSGATTAGVYRVDFILYSTMGYADSDLFTILYDYEATPEEVANAIDSMYEDTVCVGDFDTDGVIGGGDLAQLLGAWGSDNPVTDLDSDGLVAGADLAILLGRWGACSEP
ncbi:MAG: hypothetical protein VX641_07290 [Planctomycetota bacterium]|nr:hypothetical protein [Planctomycetota bacterium]